MQQFWGQCLYQTDIQGKHIEAPTIACLPVLIGFFIKTAYMFAGITALFFILYSGFKYLTSGSDAKQAQAAQQILTYTIIGLVVIILSFLIVQFIATITGVNCILQIGFAQCVSPARIPTP